MPANARQTDLWIGICCCSHDGCIPMGGMIVSSSGDRKSNHLGQARLNDITIGWC